MIKFVVYTKIPCSTCDGVKQFFKTQGIKPQYIDVTNRPDIIKEKNLQGAPVIIAYESFHGQPVEVWRRDYFNNTVIAEIKDLLKGKIPKVN